MSRAVLIVLSFIGLATLAAWLAMRYDSEAVLLVLFVLPAVIGYFYYYRRRCPECRRRLAVRRDYIGGTELFAFCWTVRIVRLPGTLDTSETKVVVAIDL